MGLTLSFNLYPISLTQDVIYSNTIHNNDCALSKSQLNHGLRLILNPLPSCFIYLQRKGAVLQNLSVPYHDRIEVDNPFYQASANRYAKNAHHEAPRT